MFEDSIFLEPERSRGLANATRGLRYGGSSSRQWCGLDTSGCRLAYLGSGTETRRMITATNAVLSIFVAAFCQIHCDIPSFSCCVRIVCHWLRITLRRRQRVYAFEIHMDVMSVFRTS